MKTLVAKNKPDPTQESLEPASINLPEKIPTFILPGALILPQALLTINATEDDEKALVDHALGKGRILGILQPRDKKNTDKDQEFFSVGGAGRITSFAETEEGNYLVGLTGICRFRIKSHEKTNSHFMMAEVDWTPFISDLGYEDEESPCVDRDHLSAAINACFKNEGIIPDWNSLQLASDDSLIGILSVACPFSITEKQALLECITLKERAELLIALLEMSIHKTDSDNHRH